MSHDHEAAEGVIKRLILALAAQIDAPAGSALLPGAAAAFAGLSRAEAGLLFGHAGHLVHYGAGTEPLELLMRLICEVQRGEALTDARFRAGDVVRLAGDAAWLRDTTFVIRYVGDDATADVQPELIDDYVLQTVPVAILRRA